MRPTRYARTFGDVTRRERREADLFAADLFGGLAVGRSHVASLPPPPRSPWGALGEGLFEQQQPGSAPVSITMSSTRRVTSHPSAPTDNLKEDILALLDRLHVLWAITNDNYDNQARYVRLVAPGAQVPLTDPSPPAAAGVTAPWRLQRTIAAITQCRHPSLAGAVIRRYMGVSVRDGVGQGSANIREDVLTVARRLNFLAAYSAFASETAAVTALAGGARASDSLLPGTLAATRALKVGLAAGTLGIGPMRADEREFGGADRLAAQTGLVNGDTIARVVWGGRGAPPPGPFEKHFSVFLPRGASADRNNVHLFFTPFYQPVEFVAQQGLRAAYDDTSWILIAVPGLFESDRPDTVPVRTAEIEACLRAAGRAARIDALRLSAHSRGYRGLAATLGGGVGGTAPIDLGLVERVTVFDASYGTIGRALTSHRTALTRLQDRARPTRFAAGAIRLYDVTVANITGLPGIALGEGGIRGLAYVRLVQEGLERGDIARSALSALDPRLRDATNRLLAALPARGRFSTVSPTPSGQTDLATFLSRQSADLAIVDHARNGLKDFITTQRLDRGAGYTRNIDAHHWFVTELAREAVE